MTDIHYTLINRETPFCDFIIKGEGELELCKIVKKHNPLPFWCEDIDSWVSSRSSAKHRVHVNKILEMCGGKTKSGFIAFTHCLSLTDTLWVKSEKENVTWSDVNLFENNFDELISKEYINLKTEMEFKCQQHRQNSRQMVIMTNAGSTKKTVYIL